MLHRQFVFEFNQLKQLNYFQEYSNSTINYRMLILKCWTTKIERYLT